MIDLIGLELGQRHLIKLVGKTACHRRILLSPPPLHPLPRGEGRYTVKVIPPARERNMTLHEVVKYLRRPQNRAGKNGSDGERWINRTAEKWKAVVSTLAEHTREAWEDQEKITGEKWEVGAPRPFPQPPETARKFFQFAAANRLIYTIP
ncbi:MAG: hypothetical protein LLG97_17590 [Deltaproteobacteria bacterium]|nr:hypothetical protein [Deltaproteobacteria bacterium]